MRHFQPGEQCEQRHRDCGQPQPAPPHRLRKSKPTRYDRSPSPDHAARFLLLCEALESVREDTAITAFEQLFKEDPGGSRVWTRYTETPSGGTWTGALGGQPFELRILAQPGCSDGMSDKRYPLSVELSVQGEQRRGCAELI